MDSLSVSHTAHLHNSKERNVGRSWVAVTWLTKGERAYRDAISAPFELFARLHASQPARMTMLFVQRDVFRNSNDGGVATLLFSAE